MSALSASVSFAQRVSWKYYLGKVCGPLLVALIAVSVATEQPLRQFLKIVILAMVICAIAVKECAESPRTYGGAIDTFRRTRNPLQALCRLVPEEIRGWLATALRLQVAAFSRRRWPAEPANAVATFHFLRRSGYHTLLPIVVLMSAVELPVVSLLLPALLPASAPVSALHALLVALSVVTLTMLIGDRRLLGAGAHVGTGEALHLDLGARCSGELPLSALIAAREIGPAEARRLSRDPSVVVVSPWDAPNAVLSLRAGVPPGLRYLGAHATWAKELALYVDRPAEMVAFVNAGITSCGSAPAK
jgi:hypothetical protein